MGLPTAISYARSQEGPAHAGYDVVPARPLNAVPRTTQTTQVGDDPPGRGVQVRKRRVNILLTGPQMKATYGIQRRDVVGAPATGKPWANLYRLTHPEQIACGSNPIVGLDICAS